MVVLCAFVIMGGQEMVWRVKVNFIVAYFYFNFCFLPFFLLKILSDHDECINGIHICNMNGICINTNGSFMCACNSGWFGDGVICEGKHLRSSNFFKFCTHLIEEVLLDVDECNNGTHNCNINASCINTNGSFMCVCDSEWSGDGVVCKGKLINCCNYCLCSLVVVKNDRYECVHQRTC